MHRGAGGVYFLSFFKFDVHYVLVGRKGPQPRKSGGRIADTLPSI